MKSVSAFRQRIARANRAVYNRKLVSEYEQNPSIFEPGRQEAIKKIISGISTDTGCRGKMLDVGCGTGNVVKLAQDYFSFVVGVDSALQLLKEVKRQHEVTKATKSRNLNLVAAEADYLPFRKQTFSCISFYGTLHHLFDPLGTLKRVAPLLAPGGWLYTDHDPNYFFHRFYHIYYRLRYRFRPGFGSPEEEIAEFHNTRTSGINPERLKERLLKGGFREVTVVYRQTTNPRLSRLARFFLALLKIFSYVISLGRPEKGRARSFYTHFYLLARK